MKGRIFVGVYVVVCCVVVFVGLCDTATACDLFLNCLVVLRSPLELHVCRRLCVVGACSPLEFVLAIVGAVRTLVELMVLGFMVGFVSLYPRIFRQVV